MWQNYIWGVWWATDLQDPHHHWGEVGMGDGEGPDGGGVHDFSRHLLPGEEWVGDGEGLARVHTITASRMLLWKLSVLEIPLDQELAIYYR